MARLLVSLIIAAATVKSGQASAQWPAHGTVYVRTDRQRWLNARQSPWFTRVAESEIAIRVDFSTSSATGATVYFAIGDSGDGGSARMRTVIAVNGHASYAGDYLPFNEYRSWLGKDTLFVARTQIGPGALMQMPAAMTWDLVPAVLPGRFVRGTRWTEPVDRSTSSHGMSQSQRGTRVSHLERDTTVNGHIYWIVRDSLRARYSEHFTHFEYAFDAESVIDRSVAGIVIGRYIVDPATHTVLARDDSAVYRGSETLRYPDHRSFTAPTKLEQSHHFESTDSATWDATRRAKAAAAPRINLFNTPRTAENRRLQARLQAGDVRATDSLLTLLATSHDVTVRDAAESKLSAWGARPGTREAIVAAQLRAGDTLGVADKFEDPARHQLTLASLRILLPFARDPGYALAFGANTMADDLFADVARRLLETPPAISSDTARWPCTIEACKQLAQYDRAGEDPRLRHIARYASFVVNPRPWADSIRTDTSLHELRDLASGFGALRPDSTRVPMPPKHSPWEAWVEWMNGRSLPAESLLANAANMPRLTFYGRAAGFYQLMSGRDLSAEWREQDAAAASPFEHYVFEWMLMHHGGWTPDPQSAAEWLVAESRIDRARGKIAAELIMLHADSADALTAAALTDRGLAYAIDGEAPWPALGAMPPMPVGGVVDSATKKDVGRASPLSRPMYVSAPAVTEALRLKWGDRVTWVDAAHPIPQSDSLSPPYVAIHRIFRSGRFARVDVDFSSTGNSYLLFLTADGWTVIAVTTWVV